MNCKTRRSRAAMMVTVPVVPAVGGFWAVDPPATTPGDRPGAGGGARCTSLTAAHTVPFPDGNPAPNPKRAGRPVDSFYAGRPPAVR